MPPVAIQVGPRFMPIFENGQDGQQELPVSSCTICCFYMSREFQPSNEGRIQLANVKRLSNWLANRCGRSEELFA